LTLGRHEELVSVVTTPAQRDRLPPQGRLILAVDGLQPDKGHEVLWVVREVLSGEVLLARSLLTSGRDDGRRLLQAARVGLGGLPVVGVISDGQLAIRQAVGDVWPGVPHQLCQFQYLQEAGRPIWEADRHAQKELRKRVRGVRTIERAVEDRTDPEAEVIRGYCAAVRGALSDSGHPPLDPGGLHRQQRLAAITASLDRVTAKGGTAPLSRLQQALQRALDATASLWPEVVIGQGWLAEAAQILANPDSADRATVKAR
jgi:hypothetical protein